MRLNLNLCSEKRCSCGQLLAILIEQGIEIKCKRCKRVQTFTLEEVIRFYKDKGPAGLQSPDPSWPQAAANAGCACHK